MRNRRSVVGKNPWPLTPRDEEIILSVGKHGQMKRDQIHLLHFRKRDGLTSVQTVCRRLRVLAEGGYLARVRLPADIGSGPFVYTPGKAAAAILNEESRSGGRGKRRRRVRSPIALRHSLEVVDFFIAVKEGLEAAGGSILTWCGESDSRHSFIWRGKSVLLTPDAYCLWAFSGEEGAFFLEWDRGTESMTRISQKLERYEAYYRLRAYRDHLGVQGLRPRLLVVVPDERREQKTAEWIAGRLAKREFSSLPTILIGAHDQVLHDILGPVWRKPTSVARIRLVD